tara:strand:- start:732 stop:1025 length:294 start_codon:yes stop_codon:yes gene_type:complete
VKTAPNCRKNAMKNDPVVFRDSVSVFVAMNDHESQHPSFIIHLRILRVPRINVYFVNLQTTFVAAPLDSYTLTNQLDTFLSPPNFVRPRAAVGNRRI